MVYANRSVGCSRLDEQGVREWILTSVCVPILNALCEYRCVGYVELIPRVCAIRSVAYTFGMRD